MKDFSIARRFMTPSFRRVGGVLRRVVLTGDGGKNSSVYEDPHMVQLVPPGDDWRTAKVFSCAISSERRKRWTCQPPEIVVVAMSEAAALSYLATRFSKIADRTAGLAQSALGAAMEKISSKPVSYKGATRRAKKTAYKNAFVVEKMSGGAFMIDIRDNIDYAKLALKGQDAINIAMKKAANKIASVINSRNKRLLDYRPLPTPFPEVKRKRRVS